MDTPTSDTRQLIRKLSRRQWKVSAVVVALALSSLFLGWWGVAKDTQIAEIINLAGRQRMLSQRMAMYLVLMEREGNVERKRQLGDMAATAAGEFEGANVRLAENARKLGAGSAIHSLYFGPAGSVDAESRRYLSQLRTALDSSRDGGPVDRKLVSDVVAAASDGLIKDLHEVTALYQREAERKVELMLRLLQVSTALIVALVAFGTFRIFRPVVRRLTDNVAARDQAASDLRESEERFKAFSESSSDWYWQTDVQDRFVWFQDGKYSRIPMAHERMLGKTRLEFVSATERADTEKWRRYAADLEARRPFRDLEYRIGGDGSVLHWISISGQPYYDDAGNFMGYRGTARNIQERKDIEASHLRLQRAIEQSPVSIMMTDVRGRFIYVNAHFSAITGYAPDEAAACTPKILWSGETPAATLDQMFAALADGKSWHGEVCGRRKDGELYCENLSVSPLQDESGQTTHYIAVGEDITAQKRIDRREERRQGILEAMANGVALPDVLGSMARMAEEELPGSICTILRLDRTRGRLSSACATPLSAAYTSAIEGIDIGDGVGSCGTAAYTARRVIVEDVETHPYWLDFRTLAAAEGLRACWSQPVMSSAGLVLGTLAIYYRSPRSPAADELTVIELLASLAAICLERDEAEKALREQQDRTRRLLAEHETILANAMVGIVYLKHRRVVSCNRRLEQIFGYEPGELIGESSERFYDSRETFDRIGVEAYRTVGAGKNYSTDLTLKRKDGSVFRGALNGCAIDPAHPHEGSIWVYADISERHRAEQEAQKLRQAVEQSPVSIVVTDRDGLIEYVNPRFSKVTGYSAQEVLGRNPRLLQSGETPPETYRQLWEALLAGGEWHGVLRNRRKNGELFWEEASMSPILDEAGRVTHFIAVKEDITDRWRINEELEQHRAHLEELVARRTADLSMALEAAKAADQAKDAFLANVSHELRTPLNAVIGLSELARRMSTDPKQQDYLEKASGAGKTLAGIINDLLDLSKISASRMELESTTFSLRQLVQRSRSVMAHRAEEKGLTLVERIDDEVPDVLAGDPLRIEQILLNLLSNAIKFTPAGRVELRIGLDAQAEGRVALGIDVEDTGIGLAAASIEKLFQPFAQADASVNRRFGGTGLGLALCKRLAEMMDGDIGISSREGRGTTFHVTLWLRRGDATDLPRTESDSGLRVLPAGYLDANVLITDDQPLNREIVVALLAEVGIVPRVAGNGREALDILQESGPGHFDLVLMDIQMPVLDGLAATRELRQREGFASLPVVAMTAHTMAHEIEISVAAGMNGHIGKPFEATDFFQMLARWIPAAKHCMAAVAADAGGQAASSQVSPGGIDRAAGLARFAGNEQRYRHWLREFLDEAPGYAQRIRQTLDQEGREMARQAAHAIKGRVGMLGMTGLHAVAAALETALKEGQPIDEPTSRLQTIADQVCEELRADPLMREREAG